jgi:Holliday junction DNA helicase RuvB
LRRVRDFAQVRAAGTITRQAAVDALAMLQIDECGFDDLDRRLLRTIMEQFEGGPVGVESLAAALAEDRDTIEDVLEPYLIQQGYLARTARGRLATARAWRHFGWNPPGGDPALNLFTEKVSK